MITEKKTYNTGPYVELVGLSADVENLPTDVANGSTFTAMDTGDEYMFNGATGVWHPVSGSGIAIEALTVTQNGTTTASSGKAYSPVTVNVPGVSAHTFTFNSPSAIEVPDAANGKYGKVTYKSNGSNVTIPCGIIKYAGDNYYILHGGGVSGGKTAFRCLSIALTSPATVLKSYTINASGELLMQTIDDSAVTVVLYY